MLTQHLLSQLLQDSGLLQIPQQLQFGRLRFVLTGLTPSAKPAYLAVLRQLVNQPILYLGSNNQNLEKLRQATSFFHSMLSGKANDSVCIFPSLEPEPYSGFSPHAEILDQRALSLFKLFQGQVDILLCPPAALLTRMPDVQQTFSQVPVVSQGSDLSPDSLVQYLAKSGYMREEPVSGVGSFSLRGGILDLFPPNSENPIRIEFFGDEVESLREFSVKSQRSIGPVQKLAIPPMREIALEPRNLRTWKELAEQQFPGPEYSEFLANQGACAANGEPFPGCEFLLPLAVPFETTLFDLTPDFLLVVDEPDDVIRWMQSWNTKNDMEYASQRELGVPVNPPQSLFLDQRSLGAHLANRKLVFFDQLGVGAPVDLFSGGNGAVDHFEWASSRDIEIEGSTTSFAPSRGLNIESSEPFRIECPTRPIRKYHGKLSELIGDLSELRQRHSGVIFVQSSLGRAERLCDILKEYDVPAVADFGPERREATLLQSINQHLPLIVVGEVFEGFESEVSNLTLIGDNDLFDEVGLLDRPSKAKQKSAAFISDFRELRTGDYIVHVDHGIGQYLGLRQIVSDGVTREFMILNYHGDAKLYVPLERLDLIQKHSSAGTGSRPQLDKLGGTTWFKTKARVKKSMRDMAEELLKLYAARRISPGFAFSPHGHWHAEFEEAFEFVETSDQRTSIEEVYRDMEASTPMDRLLCGDVGFGKTEVAMRAAFKATFDGKQVAVLAPTTVLVYQHYLRFKQRFTAFPVNVEMLSRFRNSKEQATIKEGISSGKVDVIVGTHRLLSKDIEFRDLGLLIVDEEQQFGVVHKERLRQLKMQVDTLTMTATPIPRTLHMSLLGIRDMSVIETPPRDRLAIQTVVVPFSKQVIRSALEQEMARRGQVYFVHNRVDSIYSVAAMVQKLCPNERVLVAHGQMGEKELESAMLKFVNREAGILVSTTIIENGLDIPLVNTLIVNRADRFGLAQLYQLRGRVGRSSRLAYAYLLTPPDKALSGVARQRLAALKEFSDLGSGFKIAALDLELRGAGNLLGSEQHGHINSVGFDFYCQMLERTIEEMRSSEVLPDIQSQINLRITVKIPDEYIPDEIQRLSTYKRISSLRIDSEVETLRNELEDRYGPVPEEVESLMEYVRLRILAERLLIKSIERERGGITLQFHDKTPVRPQALVDLVSANAGVSLSPKGVLKIEAAGWMPREIFANLRGLLLELGI